MRHKARKLNHCAMQHIPVLESLILPAFWCKNALLKSFFRALDGMKDLTEKLKQTVQNATDAETVAHDALGSIDLRAELIRNAMNESKKLSDASAEMKFQIDATKKALAKLEDARRPKRDADPDDVDGRIDRLRASEARITDIRKNINSMMSTLKGRLSQVRGIF